MKLSAISPGAPSSTRPALLVALASDHLVIIKLDRLGRLLEHLIELSCTQQDRNCAVRSSPGTKPGCGRPSRPDPVEARRRRPLPVLRLKHPRDQRKQMRGTPTARRLERVLARGGSLGQRRLDVHSADRPATRSAPRLPGVAQHARRGERPEGSTARRPTHRRDDPAGAQRPGTGCHGDHGLVRSVWAERFRRDEDVLVAGLYRAVGVAHGEVHAPEPASVDGAVQRFCSPGMRPVAFR